MSEPPMATTELHVIRTDSIDVLADVDTTTSAPVVGQSFRWNGTSWVPGATGDQVLRFADEAALNAGPSWGWASQTFPVVAWVDTYILDTNTSTAGQVQLLLKGDPNTASNREVVYPSFDADELWHPDAAPFTTALLNTSILDLAPKTLMGGDIGAAGAEREQWMPYPMIHSFVVPAAQVIPNTTLGPVSRMPCRMIINDVYIAPDNGTYLVGESLTSRLQVGSPAQDLFADQTLSNVSNASGTSTPVSVTGGSAGVLGLARANDPINVVFGASAFGGYNVRYTLQGWYAEQFRTINV